MGNLEHNIKEIKEAFSETDRKVKFESKDAMWNRLENHMGAKKGVAAFWRVAAILLGFLLFTGAFAAINIRAKQQKEMNTAALENEKMQLIIDSLLAIPPEVQTEIKIVEKEKIVYRNQLQYLDMNEQYEFQIKNLKNEIVQYKTLVSNSTYDVQRARDSLNLAKIEVLKLKNESKVQLEKRNSNFNLKTEKAEEQMQPAKPEPSPKMKFHIIKIQDNNLKYDTNSTLLKK